MGQPIYKMVKVKDAKSQENSKIFRLDSHLIFSIE